MKTVSKEYEAYNNLNIKMGTKKRNKGDLQALGK